MNGRSNEDYFENSFEDYFKYFGLDNCFKDVLSLIFDINPSNQIQFIAGLFLFRFIYIFKIIFLVLAWEHH
jgi:hypothetical protein